MCCGQGCWRWPAEEIEVPLPPVWLPVGEEHERLALLSARHRCLGLSQHGGVGRHTQRALIERCRKLCLPVSQSKQRIVCVTGLRCTCTEQKRDAKQRHDPEPGRVPGGAMARWRETHHRSGYGSGNSCQRTLMVLLAEVWHTAHFARPGFWISYDVVRVTSNRGRSSDDLDA